jgi:hypothetical protein
MKKFFPFVMCSSAVALYLSAVSAYAGYITPRVPPSASRALVASQAPAALPTVHTVTSAQDHGPGSLRQAIASAAPGDVVHFALRRPAVIVLNSSLTIVQDLTVLGPGPSELTVIRSWAANTPSFRVFDVEAGVVTLSGMTIRNGSAFSGTNIHDNLGGGILNRGSLTVSNCVITGNSAPTTDWGTNVPDPNFRFSRGFGAGIFSDSGSQLTILSSTLSHNQTGPLGAGGGICTFNSASYFATGCTVNGNFAGLQGGGVNFQGQIGTMQNCTITDNATSDADPSAGGGSGILNIAIENQAPPTLTLTACTVVRNTGTTNGAFTVAAVDQPSGPTNRLLSTLVAENDGPNFILYGNPTFQSLGNNLDSDGTSGLVNGANGDLVGTTASPIDAKLGLLQDNGGPTLTVALLPGSPALGAGSCSDAQGAPLPVDQRGFPRPQVTGCDIGAFENQAPTLICAVAQSVPGCTPQDGTPATLTAKVGDPDGDALVVIWSVNGVPLQTNYVAATQPPKSKGVQFTYSYPQGTNIVGVVVSDGKAVPVGCTTSVIVRDPKPPRIFSIKADPAQLWPPNGKLVPVTVNVQAVAECGSVTSKIVSVSSNEPPDGTAPDWIITGDLSLRLRAERSPHGDGRVYTITVRCTAASGESSTGTVVVRVPRNGSGR